MSAAASVKTASADSPIHEVLAERWSPYAFRDKPVSQDELRSLFEAARWAPSSYNEQPWRYVVATRDDRAQFEGDVRRVVLLARRSKRTRLDPSALRKFRELRGDRSQAAFLELVLSKNRT
jgi:nitroreductase